MIVDAHAHLGEDAVFDEGFTEDELLAAQARHGIGLTLVQPALVHDLPTVQRQHDAIADLCRRYPGRFAGLANPNPHLAEHAAEVRRCVLELGFVGIKLHPFAHAVNPGGRAGRRVVELAAGLGVPLMVHTGAGLPWSAPALLEPLAAEWPQVSLVVAHAGGGICAGEALQLAQRHANVALECSWTAGFFLQHCATLLGADRLMFGSDHADNAAVELAKIDACQLTPAARRAILGETARRVFQLEMICTYS